MVHQAWWRHMDSKRGILWQPVGLQAAVLGLLSPCALVNASWGQQGVVMLLMWSSMQLHDCSLRL